jgi:integrase
MSNGHIRQRSPGSFELRYRFDGRTRTETFRGTKRDASRRLRELMTLVDRNEHPNDPDHLTVAQWARRWLEQMAPEVARQSLRRYESAVVNHIIPAIGETALSKLSASDVQGFYTYLQSTALAPRTRRQTALVLSNVLTRAQEQRLIPINPALGLKRRLPKLGATGQMVTLSTDEARAVIAAARRSWLYLPVLLALSGGLRRGEILALNWSAIDLSAGSITVAESLDQLPGSIRRKSTKSGRSRTIAMPQSVIAELRQIKVNQAQALLMLGVRQDGQTAICMRADGTVPTPDSLSETFRYFIRRTGIKVCRFHDLRHTHATELLRLGVPLKTVAERLGHADPALTLRVYAHATPDQDREAARLLAGVLGQL